MCCSSEVMIFWLEHTYSAPPQICTQRLSGTNDVCYVGVCWQ